MISVVIPCYNAAAFINDTLESILSQDEKIEEIIIVDDGSTDGSGSVIKNIYDGRIVYIHQPNKGVSAARNAGLRLAKGRFVIFFDADDKMSEGFLKARLNVLLSNHGIGFSCGPVKTFPGLQITPTFGAAENVAEKLLTYHPHFSSCPSNYLIRKDLLLGHRIFFNEQLSSTADRFFLIQLASITKGGIIDSAPLLYRVSPDSMSNKFSKALVRDNERFYFALKKNGLIPSLVEKEFLFRIQYILGLGFIRTGSFFKGLKYTATAFFRSPRNFLKQII